jgi:tRNA1(Val) A37 N6-methylase TrmN6
MRAPPPVPGPPHEHPAAGASDPGITRETPAPGVVLWQPRRGYRYGVEVYALASFALDREAAAAREVRRVVELGAGSGVVALLLAALGLEVWAVERDRRWRPLLERSLAESQVPGRVHLVWADARDDLGSAVPAPDLVLANPPWFDPAAGPASPDPWKADARTAHHGDLDAFVAAGLRLAPRVYTVGARLPLVTPPAGVHAVARLGRRVLAEVATAPPQAAPTLPLGDVYRRWR